MASEEKTRLLAGWLYEKQATDIVALNVATICSITECIIVASARGARHAQALADATMKRAGEESLEFLSVEGYQNGDWVLMDFNDVIIHIFQSEVRSLYNIEGLWSEGGSLELGLPKDDD
ncbi:MAG: ribosome silencing factor [Proteobacteria bacterium]|nr:ribosome silencing factor [Pseudomonadota bacterium]MBU1611870.1 ribosome silencing factor [Pseudomonadota bacterium]